MVGRLSAAMALVCLVACGSSNVASEPQAKKPVANVAAKPVAPAAPAPPPYDGAGNLLPSGEHIAWLELPRGLTVTKVALADHHAFLAHGVPADRILAFFGARLIANRVEKVSAAGQRLVGGIPPGGSLPKQTILDVSVIPGAAGTVSVYIEEHPYVPPAPSFTSDDARSLLKEQQKRAE